MVNQLRQITNLTCSGGLQFCPGNHDINTKKGEKHWEDYYAFVSRLCEIEPNIKTRFPAFRQDGRFELFRSQHDLSYIFDQGQIEFISLNSVSFEPGDKEKAIDGSSNTVIGEDQWHSIQQRLGHKGGKVRIVLMHHPIIQLVSGDDRDNALFDGGRAINHLIKMEVDLVLHGHSHFYGLYEHKSYSVNEISNQQGSLKFISIPTACGKPIGGLSLNQYLSVDIGYKKPENNKRDLCISSRTYDQQTNEWYDGETINLLDFI
jgi:3',5'-cyclic AMP phosphodiesterase CpdA